MNEIIALVEAKPTMKVLCAIPFRDKTITELDVSGQCLGVEGALVIRRYLQNNGALVKFDISANALCAEGGRLLSAALKDNQIMTELNIAKNNLGKHSNAWNAKDDMSGVIAISNAIPTMGALTSLNLANDRFGVEGAKHVAEAIKEHVSALFDWDHFELDLTSGSTAVVYGCSYYTHQGGDEDCHHQHVCSSNPRHQD